MPFAKTRFIASLLRRRKNFFGHGAFDQARFDRIMSRPEPENTYAIFFTPRSGSTRVTGLVEDADLSNRPREFFNENFLHSIARNHGARDLQEYIGLIKRRQQRHGQFGFEITYKQLVVAFLTGRRFLNMVEPDRTAWLIREDIIAQAVSVTRLTQTSVSHTPFMDKEKIEKSEQAFVYSPRQISAAIMRLRWMENRTEALIRRENLDTFRFSYEMTNALGPERATRLLADKLGMRVPTGDVEEAHKKLPGTKANEFADRFRAERKDWIAKLEASRAPMLAQFEKQKDLYL